MEGISIKTIIYVVFALGWLYFNYLKKKAKGKVIEPEQADLERESKKTVAEAPVLENVSDKKISMEVVSSEPLKASANMPTEIASNLLGNDLFHEGSIDDVHRPDKKKEKLADSNNTDNVNIGHAAMTEFDLKNMVIYHEIMKRPNY